MREMWIVRKSVTHFSVVIQSEDNYGVSKPDEDQETPLGSFFFFLFRFIIVAQPRNSNRERSERAGRDIAAKDYAILMSVPPTRTHEDYAAI